MNKALAARLMLLPVVFCLAPSVASADIVKFTSGRTMSVDTCKIEDGVAVIKLREGGSMTAAASLIAEVLPDEYLHAKLETLPEFVLPAAPVSSTDDIRSLVDKLAGRHGVDAKLAHALVKVESNYQPLAVSPKGAIGLTQLMPATARELGVDEPFDAEKNLDGGLRHLRGLLDHFKSDVKLALAAYNAGAGAVARYGGVPPYRETQNYVQRIMALAK